MEKSAIELSRHIVEIFATEEELNIINQSKLFKQERMYSEEEVLNFTQTMIMQYKFGNTNIEQMDLLKESLEQFKNK